LGNGQSERKRERGKRDRWGGNGVFLHTALFPHPWF